MRNYELSKEYRTKGSDRIQINSILGGMCITALSILLTTPQKNNMDAVLIQISLAIPFLITSSLSYAKTCYRNINEVKRWNLLGWITNTFGYIMILNSVALLLYQDNNLYRSLIFIFVATSLFISYTLLDIIGNSKRIKEKVLKLLFYIILIILGSIVPIYV